MRVMKKRDEERCRGVRRRMVRVRMRVMSDGEGDAQGDRRRERGRASPRGRKPVDPVGSSRTRLIGCFIRVVMRSDEE